MNREDIIRMAREAGIWIDSDGAITGGDLHSIIPFAELVAAAEREACAKFVEGYCGAWDDSGFALASVIRARSNT